MTEAQKRVIEAARETVDAVQNFRATFLSCGDTDTAQFRQTSAIESLIYRVRELAREEQASDVCPNCGRGICLCSVNEIHINTRGCEPLDADAEKAIYDSAALLKAAYEQKGGE